jgi:hypothetical protein
VLISGATVIRALQTTETVGSDQADFSCPQTDDCGAGQIWNHNFRATGITAYLKNSGKLEIAQHIANHESPRGRRSSTTDARMRFRLDEVERILI